MKTKFLFLSALVALGFTAQAQLTAKITKKHVHQGCDYYTVAVYESNGTERTDDDELIDSGTERYCPEEKGNLLGETATVKEIKIKNAGDCKIYMFWVLDKEGNKLVSGAVGNDDCES